MKCVDFFSENYRDEDNDKQICKLLQEKVDIDTLVEWESERASQHSPGPVQNRELLYRLIFSPVHYDRETNTLTSTAFDDASNKGMSVNRHEYISEELVSQMANDRVKSYNELNPNKSPLRSFPGVIPFLCRDIRNITVKVEGSENLVRGFVVYDTAYEHDRSHADICQIVKGKALGRSVRLSIRDLANKYLKENPFPIEA